MGGMAREPQEMAQGVAASMKARTGRSIDEWVSLVAESGLDPLDQLAVRRWLKDVHGVPQNSQWAIAFAAAEKAGWTMPSPAEFADALFAGAKAGLRPLHDAIVARAASLGPDAEIQGRGGYTPVVRRTQFVAVGPGPRGTLRVGLRYRSAVPDDERLSPAKGFAQATHWLHLEGGTDPQAAATALEGLLRAAYEQNA